MSSKARVEGLVTHKRVRTLERDVAVLQVELEALSERLDMVEGENKALRAMWGGTTHTGQPYWLSQTYTSSGPVWAGKGT